MPRRVLITGITGFAGSHLAERLLSAGHEVHGLAHEPAPHPHLREVGDRVTVHAGDLLDTAALRAAVDAARPDVVYHLAGQAVPTIASEDPVAAINVNVLGAANVAAALAERPEAALVAASSADVYGHPERIPTPEAEPARPANVYSATKVAAEAVLRARGGGRVVILRPANQVGPRQHPRLAASEFARQIAEAEIAGREAVIRHGDLEARRDFLDVRDMARAYEAAADLAGEGVEIYNVGTGTPVSVGDILRILIGLARVGVRTELDPSRVRSGVPPVLSLDDSRFRARTGWSPRIPLERSLADTLDHWRTELARDLVRS